MLVKSVKIVPPEFNNTRLDVVLSSLLPEYSRSKIQDWIKAGLVTIDNKTQIIPKIKVYTEQNINIDVPTNNKENLSPAQQIDLNVVYEDDDLIVINKPAGLVVHPGAGCADHTLLNALLYRYPKLAMVPRAGIIHRLDKDTSGLLVIAHNLISHTKLVAELQERKIKREYLAVVNKVMTVGGTVNAPIGRHPTKRTHMAVTAKNGKPATTHYRVIKRFNAHTLLQVILDTGRTHQIRVHLAHIGYPIIGDQTYNKSAKIVNNFKRQALHAEKLGLTHPTTNKPIQWQADMPKDMQELLLNL